MKLKSTFLILILLLTIILTSNIFSNDGFQSSLFKNDNKTWSRSNGNNYSDKFSDLSQINKRNVANLKLAWVFHSNSKKEYQVVETNPIFTGDFLINADVNGHINAINPLSGKLEWSHSLPQPAAKRGMTFNKGRIYVPTSNGVYVLNSKDGMEFKSVNGSNLKYGSTLTFLPPVIGRGKLFNATYAGSIEAYDIKSGKDIWKKKLDKDTITARLWSGISYDETLDILYVVTSNPGGLIGKGIKKGGYSCSLIALDGVSGNIIWQFQEVIHDVWDLDVVGPPILTSIIRSHIKIPVVAAVTKRGNVILVNRKTGTPIFPVSTLKVPLGVNPNYDTSLYQPNILSPEPFSDIEFDPKKNVTNLSADQHDYIMHKIRNSSFEKFTPPNLNNDVVLFGLSGGAEWPGAALDQRNSTLVVPSNKVPWILRTDYIFSAGDLADKIKSQINKNHTYSSKCLICHKFDFSGYYEGEQVGDAYIPSLVGITLKRDKSKLLSINVFDESHKYVVLPEKVTKKDLKFLYELFAYVDKSTTSIRVVRSYWQWLLDSHKLPGSNPPWGYLTAIDLNTGKRSWQIPFGVATDPLTNNKFDGDLNYGGIIVTAGNLVVANGTRDSKARIYNIENGAELWQDTLPSVGSSPPMTYFFKGCQYIVFNATGGQFVGFGKTNDLTVAYKLKECNVK